MRTLLSIFIAVFWMSVIGCGNYVLKSEVETNYLPRAEVEANYIAKAEILENYVPKSALLEAFKGFSPASTDRTSSAATVTAANEHTCRYRYAPGYYIDICLLGCPPPPYWQDLGVPCPQ